MSTYFILFLVIIYTFSPVKGIIRSLEPEERYKINWEIIGDEIEIELFVQTIGFIGFGLSWNGAMKDADIITVGVDIYGIPYLHDRHGVGEVEPVIDESQDYKLISAFENGTHTIAKISRLINTCDENDHPITGDTTRVIWSIGETDDIKYHGRNNRGVISTNFFEGTPEQPDLSPYSVWTAKSNYTMPSKDTTYWVTFHKAPVLEKKHHIYGFDVYLGDENAKKHTHHIDFFRCTTPDGEDADEFFGPYAASEGFDLDGDDEYYPMEHCYLIAFSWSIGALITMFPDHIGLVLGTVQHEYYLMIVHYDNKEELSNIQFDTGLEFYYTETLRKFDGGFLNVRSTYDYSMMIPPYASDFLIHGQCDSECTKTLKHDVKLIRVLLHSHLAGRKMRVRHFRDGQELPWIASDSHYDFNYQQNLKLEPEIVFKAGDHLTIECTYDSTWRDGNVTLGGESTREEMCMAFIIYYPLLDGFQGCGSGIRNDKILNYFGITKVLEDQSDPLIQEPVEYNGIRWSQYLKDLEWTDEMRADYQNFLIVTPHQARCPGFGNLTTTYPDFEAPYEEIDICQSQTTEPTPYPRS